VECIHNLQYLKRSYPVKTDTLSAVNSHVLLHLSEGKHLQDPGVEGRIILKRIFKTWDGGHGLDQCGSRQGQVAVCCEYGNEPLGFF
jgi:hypothetical protein